MTTLRRSKRLEVTALAVFMVLKMYGLTAACKVAEDYIGLSNYELVRTTEVIVLASVTGFSSNETDIAQFRVEKILKGEVKSDFLYLEGFDSFKGAGDDTDFRRARPGAYLGSCIAYDYRRNHRYLLFLGPENGRLEVMFIAFARVNEEVESGSNWLRAVQEYIRIGSLEDYEKEKSELQALRLRLREGNEDPLFARAVIKDIEAHFSIPSKYKSVEDLIQIYCITTDDTKRRWITRFLQKKTSNASKKP